MAGLKQVILPASAGAVLVCAPVAPAHAFVPLIAFLGHLMIAHHVVGAAARIARAPFVAASTAALIAEQSTAAYAAYAPPPPYYYGYSGQSSWYPYSAPPVAYSPQPYYPAPAAYYAGPPRSYASAPPYYGRAHYPRAPGYYTGMPAYPGRPVYYGGSRGYYRAQVSYPRSVPRAYGPARSFDAPRANYRGTYAFQSAGRGGGYRR